MARKKTAKKVLVIDLDGTSIHTDTFHELMVAALKQKPWMILQVLWWLLVKSRPYAKEKLSKAIELNPTNLPYNQEFLREVYDRHKKGHPVVMATGTHWIVAEKVGQYLGFIQEIIATDGTTNMTGQNKADQLLSRYGDKKFIYAGDSRKDEKIWAFASDVWVVNPKWKVEDKGQKWAASPAKFKLFPRTVPRWKALLNILEPQLWLYNVVLFIPILFVGKLMDVSALFACLSLSVISSGCGIVRDLLNLDMYRKENLENAFAKGHLYLSTGLVGGPLLLLTGFVLACYTLPTVVMILLLWMIILIRNDGLMSGLSRIICPFIVGFLL